jgi:hypothetical protein
LDGSGDIQSIPRFLKSKGKSVDKAQIILQQQYFTHADTPFPVLDEDISHSIIPKTWECKPGEMIAENWLGRLRNGPILR